MQYCFHGMFPHPNCDLVIYGRTCNLRFLWFFCCWSPSRFDGTRGGTRVTSHACWALYDIVTAGGRRMGWVALRWPWHAHRPLLQLVTQFNLLGHVTAAGSRKLNSLTPWFIEERIKSTYCVHSFSYPFILSFVLVLWHWHTACLQIIVNPKDLWRHLRFHLCLGYNNENDNNEWFHPRCSASTSVFIPLLQSKKNVAFMGCWNNPRLTWSVSFALYMSLKQAGNKLRLSALCDQMQNNFAGRSRYLHSASVSVCECRRRHGCLVSPTVPDLLLPWRPIGRAPDTLLSRPCWHPINAGLQCFYLEDRFPF